MDRRRLPIGIQTFRRVREDGCYYVDKTPHITSLLESGTHYFLSRPRRFGKSLFLDTLKELFEGSEGLFEGLAIDADGCVVAPDGPGLGVEYDWDCIMDHCTDRAEYK